MANARKNTSYDHYVNNKFIHRSRTLKGSRSEWVRGFDCSHMRPLIICRGPVRKEAMEIFAEMGITQYGILLSDKDSIQFPSAQAPELRLMRNPRRVHRVSDYTGVTKNDRLNLIDTIIQLCKEFNYDSVFAGYGFMSEDPLLVEKLENAGLVFIGPNSKVVLQAGQKDLAKKIAEQNGVSVTSGISNLTAHALLRKFSSLELFKSVAESVGLTVSARSLETCEELLEASYKARIDLLTVDEIANEAVIKCAELFSIKPRSRLRLKAIGGGGGKGQRIIPSPQSDSIDDITEASRAAYTAYKEVLAEVKALGVGDNKNVLIEQNIESIRHQEVQLIGNGEWCISLGARDCSAQMHEQKLVEVSLTQEALKLEAQHMASKGYAQQAARLIREEQQLVLMERSAEIFGAAVGLDSVSTFECIVDHEHFYFMEMNTRIQVEHRVSELCYLLKFVNPASPDEFFLVDSLIEMMVLLAAHGRELPKPVREVRHFTAVEVRLNATDDALKPCAGGYIEHWSDPMLGEVRDDQGICLKNPDSAQFIRYQLAGAYDSNIALLITVGDTRKEAVERLCEALRITILKGDGLSTNLEFLYGYLNWWISSGVYTWVTTQWVQQYLTFVGTLAKLTNSISVAHIYESIIQVIVQAYRDAGASEIELKSVIRTLADKQTLITRPIERLFASPHLFAGWLFKFRDRWCFENGAVVWKVNPIEILESTYHYLNMEFFFKWPALRCIWSDDWRILEQANQFYKKFLWSSIINKPELQQEHLYYQLGMELFQLLPAIGSEAGLQHMNTHDLEIYFPNYLNDLSIRQAAMSALSPPPPSGADQIVAPMSGVFYPRPSPDEPLYVAKGSRFEVGDPLFIIEVMKMFNTVKATFSGVIEEVLIDSCGGQSIKKGQILFKVKPDNSQMSISVDKQTFECEPWLHNLRWVIDDVWRKNHDKIN